MVDAGCHGQFTTKMMNRHCTSMVGPVVSHARDRPGNGAINAGVVAHARLGASLQHRLIGRHRNAEHGRPSSCTCRV